MDKNKTIIITVTGGVADIYHCPEDINVVMIDYDNLESGDYTYCPVCYEYHDEWNGVCKKCGYNSRESEDQVFELENE